MPGLLRGVGRIAAVAGTATAVSNRVSRRQAGHWSQQEAPPEPEPTYAEPAPAPPPAAPHPDGRGFRGPKGADPRSLTPLWA
jgi:hypothetical protein